MLVFTIAPPHGSSACTFRRVAGATGLNRRRALPGSGTSSFVRTAIFGDFLFALVEPLHNRRSPWYQHGLICEALPKVSVILLHDIEDRFLGELSMVLGK
jgi:hypothetical protein